MHVRKYNYNRSFANPEFEAGGIHPFHEILYIAAGRIELIWLNQRYEAAAPALFILDANSPHQLLQKSAQYAYYYLELESSDEQDFLPISHAKLWNGLQGNLELSSPAVSLLLGSAELLGNLIEQHTQYSARIFEDLAIQDIRKIMMLIRHLLQPLIHPQEQQPMLDDKYAYKQTIIQALMRFMEAAYLEPITLQTLVDQVHLNPSYLIRLFREVQHMTPFQYLNTLRMNAAISYLKESSLSIQEIAFKSGYGSIHYFSRIFKQKYGVSPSAWRVNALLINDSKL